MPGKILSPSKCRAERTLLGWSLQDLAMRSGFHPAKLEAFEEGQQTLALSAQVAIMRILKKALSDTGVTVMQAMLAVLSASMAVSSLAEDAAALLA